MHNLNHSLIGERLEYYMNHNALAIKPIIKMPMKLKVKEIGINHDILNLEKPRMLTPNSSGNGEAMIRAPARNVNHLKYFILIKALNRLPIP